MPAGPVELSPSGPFRWPCGWASTRGCISPGVHQACFFNGRSHLPFHPRSLSLSRARDPVSLRCTHSSSLLLLASRAWFLITRVFVCLWPHWALVATLGPGRRAGFPGWGVRGSSAPWRAGASLQRSLLAPSAGLVAPQHVASSQTRDQAGVPCTGRWVLNRITREVPSVKL